MEELYEQDEVKMSSDESLAAETVAGGDDHHQQVAIHLTDLFIFTLNS